MTETSAIRSSHLLNDDSKKNIMKELFNNKIVRMILIAIALIIYGALEVYHAEYRAESRADKKSKQQVEDSIDDSFKDFKLNP